MDVKSAFLNGEIDEEFQFRQSSGFEHTEFPNKVFRLKRALYELKQVPRACYGTLKKFLLDRGFKPGSTNPTLFTRVVDNDLFLCQIYVDDIIFGCTNNACSLEFRKMMSEKYQMSMMGELKLFLGLQICPQAKGIFISQVKYLNKCLKKFEMQDSKMKGYKNPMPTNGKLDVDVYGNDYDQKAYRLMIGSFFSYMHPDMTLC